VTQAHHDAPGSRAVDHGAAPGEFRGQVTRSMLFQSRDPCWSAARAGRAEVLSGWAPRRGVGGRALQVGAPSKQAAARPVLGAACPKPGQGFGEGAPRAGHQRWADRLDAHYARASSKQLQQAGQFVGLELAEGQAQAAVDMQWSHGGWAEARFPCSRRRQPLLRAAAAARRRSDPVIDTIRQRWVVVCPRWRPAPEKADSCCEPAMTFGRRGAKERENAIFAALLPWERLRPQGLLLAIPTPRQNGLGACQVAGVMGSDSDCTMAPAVSDPGALRNGGGG